MNSGTRAALRRLGLVLAVGGLVAGSALAADAPAVSPSADEVAAAPDGAPGGDADRGPGPPRGHGGYGDRDGFGGHGGPGFGPGREGRWHHGEGMGRRRGFGDHEHGMMVSRGFFSAMRQLNLTPVQREQMRSIVFNAREAVRMQRANDEQSGAAQRRREDLAVLSNPGDPNYAHAVEQLKSRAAERVQQAITRATDTEQKLYNVLTAEQKAQLPKVLSDQRARREQRMQQMRRRHESGADGPGGPQPPPPPPQ